MCGIAGFIGQGSQEILEKMTNALRHRGPDDAGFFIDESAKVGLGHRRLSIIDLASGRQPMFNEDKSVVIIFNGEIYNFQELKVELEKKGHRFATNSDTEVIIHLYEEVGEKVFDQLNGMYALAIWDKNKKQLLLARDRIGKKPLYYAQFGSAFIFGSELKALLPHPAVKKEIDWNSFNKFLTYEYVPTPHSIFKNIYKLEPGYYLIYKDGKIEKRQYWDASFKSKVQSPKSKVDDYRKSDFGYPKSDFAANIIEFDHLLADSVRKRLIADVPLGIFLSGGIDSSTIAYYAQKVSASPVKTFSIAFADKSFDESAHAQKVAKWLKTEHYEKTLTPKALLELVPKIMELTDEPFADASIIPTYLLSKFTRQKVTVALGGDGGDELLLGYPTFQAEKIYQLLKKFPKKFNQLFSWSAKKLPTSFNNISFDFKIKKFVAGLGYPDLYRHQVWLGTLAPGQSKQLLTPEVQNKINDEKLFEDIDKLSAALSGREQPKDNWSLINYLYLKQYLQDDILVKVDRASMFASLEVRAPLLDYRLIDFITALPLNYKLRGFTTKYLLKKLMAGKLPPEIIRRPKKGFGIPLAKWINSDLRDFTADILSEKKIKEQGILNYKFVSQLLDEHRRGKKDHRKILWALMVWQLWLENN